MSKEELNINEDLSNDSNLNQASVLLIALENEYPGITKKVFSALGKDKSKLLLERISIIGKVSGEKTSEAIDSFYRIAIDKKFIFGGLDFSSKILKETFGINKAREYFENKKEKFKFLEDVDTKKLIKFFAKESDQTKVFLLNFISSKQIADILEQIDDEMLPLKLLRPVEIPSMQLLYDFEIELSSYFNKKSNRTIDLDTDNLAKIAEAIEYLPDDKRKLIINIYEKNNSDIAEKVKRLVFTFEDFLQTEDTAFRMILFEVSDFRQIAISKLQTSSVLQKKIDDCMIKRTKNIVDSESIGLENKVNTSQIDEAKRSIISLARRMEREGSIALRNG